MKEIGPGISIDGNVRFGKPVITGTRVSVASVIAELASGASIEQVMEDYALTADQVRSALGYVAQILEEEDVSAAG